MNSILEYIKELCKTDKVMLKKYKDECTLNLLEKDREIMELKKQIEILKKTRKCCFCGSCEDPENLKQFNYIMYDFVYYPSFFYCNKYECVKHYLDELEGVVRGLNLKLQDD